MNRSLARRIGLGSAQFGMDYGVSNREGRVPPREVAAILELAAERGLRVIDTAPAYGDAEEVLGAQLPRSHGFAIVTKTPSGESNPVRLREVFLRSLDRLKQETLHALLVHDAEALLATDGDRLIEALMRLRDEGRVETVGVSIYDAGQIDAVEKRFAFGIVQVPLNVFDQRLRRSGHLERLKKRGVEIHARSIFLQGLLLMAPEDVPARWDEARRRLAGFRNWAQGAGMTPLAASLKFAMDCPEVDAFVLGVSRAAELLEILDGLDRLPEAPVDFASLACFDESVVDPRRWERVSC